MMGGGEFKISLMQQMIWSGTDNKNMMASLMPCAEEQEASTKIMPPISSPSMLLPQQLLQISSGLAPEVGATAGASLATDVHDGQGSNMTESWSQLLLRDSVGDHERYSVATALLSKGLEEGPMRQAAAAAAYNFYGHGDEVIQTSGTNKSQGNQMLLASPPRSCITTSLGSNMLDFSSSTVPAPVELRNHLSDNSSEGNSTGTGTAPNKKARVQTSSSAQSTLKVRKERLGDRITALHQIVSPFGKTDTASVLQETIGYIRFLISQIEALSFPYMGHSTNGNGNSMQQQRAPLNLHNDCNGTADAEGETEQHVCVQDEDQNGGDEGNDGLRSRGLCLVPVSCTSHLAADDSGCDLWAAAAVAPPPPPPQFGGMVWR